MTILFCVCGAETHVGEPNYLDFYIFILLLCFVLVVLCFVCCFISLLLLLLLWVLLLFRGCFVFAYLLFLLTEYNAVGRFGKMGSLLVHGEIE